MVRNIVLAASLSVLASAALAQELRVMAWNINAGEQSLAELEANARDAIAELWIGGQ